jgi:tetratricopeptide (TPR) repeat protein
MSKVHAASPSALVYAFNRLGDAERELGEDGAALEAFEKSIGILQQDTTAAEGVEQIWAKHSMASALGSLGKYAEAEAAFTALVPSYEQRFGPTQSWTITLRSEIARCVLEQGRATEALSMLRDNLKVSEKTLGAGRPLSIITRYLLALAVLKTDDAKAAAKILEPIPTSITDPDWYPRYSAGLSLARARIADALGDRAGADTWLSQAARCYAEAYPPHHPRRQLFDNYVADREALG